MVTGRARFAHNRQALCIEASEKHTAFDLGTRHGHIIIYTAQTRRPDANRCVVAVLTPHDIGAHAAQRINDAPHRAATNLGSAVEEAGKFLPGQQTREQTNRRARVGTVEHCIRLLQPVDAAAMHDQFSWRQHLDLNAQVAHHLDGGATVMAVEKVAHGALTLRNAPKHDSAMANRFITRHTTLTGEGRAAGYGYVGHKW